MSDRIKEFRISLGMTQEEFGERIGLSKSGISNIESGARGIRDRHIKLICSMFNVNEEWLRSGENHFDKLAPDSKSFLSFIKYLESLGYTLKIEKEVLKWHPEDIVENSNVIGVAQIVDAETYSVTITQGKYKTIYSESDFEVFKSSIEKSIEFELYKSKK